MQISVSSTLTVCHDGQFWVGIVEHVEEGRLGVTRIVFGAEPSEGEILRLRAHSGLVKRLRRLALATLRTLR